MRLYRSPKLPGGLLLGRTGPLQRLRREEDRMKKEIIYLAWTAFLLLVLLVVFVVKNFSFARWKREFEDAFIDATDGLTDAISAIVKRVCQSGLSDTEQREVDDLLVAKRDVLKLGDLL